MKVLELDQDSDFRIKGSVLTIGNFDGLHIGHQKIMGRLFELANNKRLPSLVMSFAPHPMKILQPNVYFENLFSRDDLSEQLKKLGIDLFVLEQFNRSVAELSPREFLKSEIIERFRPSSIVVGYDFVFGKNKAGDIPFLSEHQREFSFELEVCGAIDWNSKPVSSSRIRACLKAGDLESVNNMLGRNYYLQGLVVPGEGRGRTIGVPTANLQTFGDRILCKGVYATRTEVGGKLYDSVTNVGEKPTFHKEKIPVTVETHLMDVDIDLRKIEVKVHFVCKIREERRFDSAESLVEQIHKDMETSKVLLNG